MFPNTLIELRKKHKLSQEELAQALHISLQTVIQWEEYGEVPSENECNQLCTYFHIEKEALQIEKKPKKSYSFKLLVVLCIGAIFLMILCFILHTMAPAPTLIPGMHIDSYLIGGILSFILVMMSLFALYFKK